MGAKSVAKQRDSRLGRDVFGCRLQDVLPRGTGIGFAEMNLHPFTGMELLARIRKHSPNALVILTSAFGTTQSVIEAMKMGAFDFVRKEQLPFNIKVVADSALQAAAEVKAANAFKPQLTVEQHRDEIVGRSEAMQQVFKMIGRVAGSDAAVMITGESGSGKELVACAIHSYSARSNKSFLAINCAAIPDNLLESELLATRKALSPAPTARGSADLSNATRARFSSTRSAKCHCRFKVKSCASCRKASSPASEEMKRSKQMSESFAPRIKTWKRKSRNAHSAKTFFTASMSSAFKSRPSASGRKM